MRHFNITEDSLHEKAKHEMKDGLEKRYQKYYEKYGVKELIKTGFDEKRKQPENSQYVPLDAYSIRNKENIDDQNALNHFPRNTPTQYSDIETDKKNNYMDLKNEGKSSSKNKMAEKENFLNNQVFQEEKVKSPTETKNNKKNKKQNSNSNNETKNVQTYKEQYNKVYKLDSTFADDNQGCATEMVETFDDFENTCQSDWGSLQSHAKTLYDNGNCGFGYSDSITVTDSSSAINNDANNNHNSYRDVEYPNNSENFPYIDTANHALSNKEMETIFEEASICSVGSNNGTAFNSGFKQPEKNGRE